MSDDSANQRCPNCFEPKSVQVPCAICSWPSTGPHDDAFLPPGTRINAQYFVGRVLGSGGFGITYLGWDAVLESKVAIKEYYPRGYAKRAASGQTVEPASTDCHPDYRFGLDRFLAEARTIRRFAGHANIVRVENLFAARGTAYMILEFLDGSTFENLINRFPKRAAPWETTMNVMEVVLKALSHLHANQVLHRDISPDNVFILRDGTIKLIDFGAARSLNSNASRMTVVLKPGFAPIEQYQERGNIGPQADVYAAAATIYRAITGQRPPPATDRLFYDPISRPSQQGVVLPGAAESALMLALSMDPAARFSDCDSFLNGLRQPFAAPTVREQVSPALPSPAVSTAGLLSRPGGGGVIKPVSNKLKGFAAGVCAVLLVGLGGVWKFIGSGSPEQNVVPVSVGRKSLGEGNKLNPVITAFALTPTVIVENGSATVEWRTEGAEQVTLNGAKVPSSGSKTWTAAATASLTLVASRPGSAPTQKSIVLEVRKSAPLAISFLTATPQDVLVGETVQLGWSLSGASRVELNGEKVVSSGSKTAQPAKSVLYRLVGWDEQNRQVEKSIQVVVKDLGSDSKSPLSLGRPALAANLVFKSPITFPQETQHKGGGGIVVLNVLIDKFGRVESASPVSSSNGVLESAAAAGVRTWKYKPFLVGGKPVRVTGEVVLSFQLPPPKQVCPPWSTGLCPASGASIVYRPTPATRRRVEIGPDGTFIVDGRGTLNVTVDGSLEADSQIQVWGKFLDDPRQHLTTPSLKLDCKNEGPTAECALDKPQLKFLGTVSIWRRAQGTVQ